MDEQVQRQYDLSDRMYSVLYKNDKPQYQLTTDDFMQLLFIMDELSTNPLFGGEIKELTK
jgi:hypothetical protein